MYIIRPRADLVSINNSDMNVMNHMIVHGPHAAFLFMTSAFYP